MKKNLKAVALLIIGIAVTAAAYTLTTDASAGNNQIAEASSKDSTSQSGKKKPVVEEKTESKMAIDSTESRDGKTSEVVADTVTTKSGLKYVITRKGRGDIAQKGDKVAIHYYGRLASNGKEFDNSYKRNQPYQFKLGAQRVIRGWDEGIVGMSIGEERTLIIPSELGYGKRGRGSAIPSNSVLVFDLVLVSIK